MMKLEKEKSKVIYDSFCINEQKRYLKTFHRLLDRITGISLYDYVFGDDERCLEYYDKMFQGWLRFLSANLPNDLIEIRGKKLLYEVLYKMIISHKVNEPLMPKWLLQEFLDEKSKIYLKLYNFQDTTDLKKTSNRKRDFRGGRLNPADLIYHCLYYDLFKDFDPKIKFRGKEDISDMKRLIQKRSYELKNRVYYNKVIDFLLTNVYLLLDPDYKKRRKRGRNKKHTSLPTNPTLYELLPKRSNNYERLLKNFRRFFEQNHCLSVVLILNKPTPNGNFKFLDFKIVSVPYIPFHELIYQEILDTNNEIKILRISERDSVSQFLSLTGLNDSIGIYDEKVAKIEFLYCLTIARNRLESLINRIDNVFCFNCK